MPFQHRFNIQRAFIQLHRHTGRPRDMCAFLDRRARLLQHDIQMRNRSCHSDRSQGIRPAIPVAINQRALADGLPHHGKARYISLPIVIRTQLHLKLSYPCRIGLTRHTCHLVRGHTGQRMIKRHVRHLSTSEQREERQLRRLSCEIPKSHINCRFGVPMPLQIAMQTLHNSFRTDGV